MAGTTAVGAARRVLASRLILAFGIAAAFADSRAGAAPRGSMLEIHRSVILPSCVYSVYRDPSGCDDSLVLYYFHGSGGDETTWIRSDREVVDSWLDVGALPPIVVAPTFGKEWLAFPEGSSSQEATVEAFVREIMPEIERTIGAASPRRLLWGFSNGGANAAQIFFRYPELFDRAALVSPLIYELPPDAPDASVDALASEAGLRESGLLEEVKRAVAGRSSFVRNILREMENERRNLAASASWEKACVLDNMKAPPPSPPREVYVSCGKEDETALFPGARALASKAARLGYIVFLEALEGGHMSMDKPRIGAFLMGESP